MLQRVTPKGFIDSEGIEHECDIFVCATGFDTSFRPRFPVVVDGVNVQERWREYPVDAVSLRFFFLSWFDVYMVEKGKIQRVLMKPGSIIVYEHRD